MKVNKNIVKSLALVTIMGATTLTTNLVYADGVRVVTLGKDLSATQRETVLNYFGVKESEAQIIEVTNADERKYLEGVATESQLGKKTFSCAYVDPSSGGKGIQVKTANLTFVTSDMIASTMVTSGVEEATVVATAPFGVSGTGALTGIMMSLEESGIKLDEEKKELASEELVVTGDLGEDIGVDQATGIINDVKTEIIKNNTSDTTQIAGIITNVTNNYNVTLTGDQSKQIEDLMGKVAEQDYDYKSVKKTLNTVSDNVTDKLVEEGVINRGFFESIGNWFKGVKDKVVGMFDSKDDSILANTDDSALGEDVVVDSTDKGVVDEKESFFDKIINWFKGLFGNDEAPKEENKGVDSDSAEDVDNGESDNGDSSEGVTDGSSNDTEVDTTVDGVNNSEEDKDIQNTTDSNDTTVESENSDSVETTDTNGDGVSKKVIENGTIN